MSFNKKKKIIIIIILIVLISVFVFWQLLIYINRENQVSCGSDYSYKTKCFFGQYCRLTDNPLEGGYCSAYLSFLFDLFSNEKADTKDSSQMDHNGGEKSETNQIGNGDVFALLLGADPTISQAEKDLSSIENKALLAYDLLVKYYDYSQDNVKFLINKDKSWIKKWKEQGGIAELGPTHKSEVLYIEPTVNNLEESMNWLSKVSDKNDKVVIMIFSHGSQIQDLDNDDRDGIDEALNLNDGTFTDDQLADHLSNIQAKEIIIIINSCYSAGFIYDIESKTENTKLRIVASSPEELPYQSNMVAAGSDFSFPYPDKYQDSFGIMLFGLTNMEPGKVTSAKESIPIENAYSKYSDSCEIQSMGIEFHVAVVSKNTTGSSKYTCNFCGEVLEPTGSYQPIYGYFNNDLSNKFYLYK